MGIYMLTGGVIMVNVKGRWALITGAARGIGYLSAKFMAEQGCNLRVQKDATQPCPGILDKLFTSPGLCFIITKIKESNQTILSALKAMLL